MLKHQYHVRDHMMQTVYGLEVCNYLDISDYRDIIRLIEIKMAGLFIQMIVNFHKLLVYQRISDGVGTSSGLQLSYHLETLLKLTFFTCFVFFKLQFAG